MTFTYFFEFPALAVPSLLLSLVLFGMLSVLTDARKPAAETGEPSPSSDEILLKDILFEMEDSQLFLKKGLTLTDLTRLVASNRSYVSGCINDHIGLSFTDFVNSYRVRYAQTLLKWNIERLTINEIRDRSGFETESTFIRNFRKFTGCSPSEWQRANAEEKKNS